MLSLSSLSSTNRSTPPTAACMTQNAMIITETSKGDIVILSLDGRLDALSAPEFRNKRSVIDPDTMVIIDLEKVDLIDESGLEAIISAFRNKRDANGVTVLAGMNERLRRVFEITNVHKLVNIFDDVASATEYLKTLQNDHS